LDGMQDNAVANATQSRHYNLDQGQEEAIVDRSTQARLHLTVRREDPPRVPCHFSYASTAIIGAAFKAPPVQPLPGPFRPREQGDETPSILCALYLYHSPDRQPVSTLIIVCQNKMLPLRAGCISLHFGVRVGSIVPGEAL
jgi:hypothetical protein